MKIETNRLILQRPSLKEAKDLAENGNEKSMPYFTWYIPYPFTENNAKKIIKEFWLDEKKGNVGFSIRLKEENKVIGIIDIYSIKKEHKKAKIGYWIGKKYRGKGLASEAVRAVINYAFNNLKLDKLSADTLVDNEASNILLKKVGFREVGIMQKERIIDGKAIDCYLWEILKK
ncbi:MAG: GNAT family protein [Nanoarchaeota archaeon]|nr:GNAT family protein [Nanoarchaeota archaeon]